jgi:small subunit ribosomal protein S2
VDYVIPGNDDALRAISLYCDLVAGSVIEGLKKEIIRDGGDMGEDIAPVEDVIATEAPAAPEATPEATPEVEAAPAVDAPVETPVETPAETPVETSADAPVESPVETPAETPAEEAKA